MKKIFYLLIGIISSFFTISCTSSEGEIQEDGKFLVQTDIIVDGVKTKASTEAGYTTGAGTYHLNEDCTVAAYANAGYELVSFTCDQKKSLVGASTYTTPVDRPLRFVATFKKQEFILTPNPIDIVLVNDDVNKDALIYLRTKTNIPISEWTIESMPSWSGIIEQKNDYYYFYFRKSATTSYPNRGKHGEIVVKYKNETYNIPVIMAFPIEDKTWTIRATGTVTYNGLSSAPRDIKNLKFTITCHSELNGTGEVLLSDVSPLIAVNKSNPSCGYNTFNETVITQAIHNRINSIVVEMNNGDKSFTDNNYLIKKVIINKGDKNFPIDDIRFFTAIVDFDL